VFSVRKIYTLMNTFSMKKFKLLILIGKILLACKVH
jgi:hypothetical protein